MHRAPSPRTGALLVAVLLAAESTGAADMAFLAAAGPVRGAVSFPPPAVFTPGGAPRAEPEAVPSAGRARLEALWAETAARGADFTEDAGAVGGWLWARLREIPAEGSSLMAVVGECADAAASHLRWMGLIATPMAPGGEKPLSAGFDLEVEDSEPSPSQREEGDSPSGRDRMLVFANRAVERFDEGLLRKYSIPTGVDPQFSPGGRAYPSVVPRIDGPWRSAGGLRYRMSYLHPSGISRADASGFHYFRFGRPVLQNIFEVLPEKYWGVYGYYAHGQAMECVLEIENAGAEPLGPLSVAVGQEVFERAGGAGPGLGPVARNRTGSLAPGERAEVRVTFHASIDWRRDGSVEQTHVTIAQDPAGNSPGRLLVDDPQASLVDPLPELD